VLGEGLHIPGPFFAMLVSLLLVLSFQALFSICLLYIAEPRFSG
jgi:hypothetical protein